MPISQTTITGSLRRPNNADAAVTGISFRLSASDHENGEWVVVNTVAGVVDTPDGDFTVTLWPNDMGMFGNTTYSVSLTFSDGSTVTDMKQVYVRYSETPITMEDLAFEALARVAVLPYKLKMVTADQYANENPKDPLTAYLVRTT